MAEKKNKLKITVYGYDVATTEEAARLVSEKISQLKLKFSGPGPLPTQRKLRSVIKSPHKHKDSQEQFTKKTHQRIIEIDIADISPSALESLEKLKVPNTAYLTVKIPNEKK
jgi:small subunit ribosomal protein S10